MQIPLPGGRAASQVDHARFLSSPYKILIVSLVSAIATLVVAYNYNLMPSPFDLLGRWAKEQGHGAFGDSIRLRHSLAMIPGQLFRRDSAQIPELHIDIKFKDLQKLRKKREEALATTFLIQGPNDFVPASIRYEASSTKVKLRLKGDQIDHLGTRKWSFRIHVKGKKHIFGMRRFSLQSPKVRKYQAEVLFFETLRHMGLLAPRYMFVDVTVNGEAIGLMALEEHFSKELLEYNGRKESVILRFDESLLWAARASDPINQGKTNAFGFMDFQNAPIDAFRSTRIAKSKRLSKEYAVAVGLLRGFVNEKLSAADVFDVQLMGRFLAVVELWDAWHSIFWHNLRFYFNPYTLKLEPIGFDASIRTPLRVTPMLRKERIVSAMLDNPDLFASYKDSLHVLAQQIVNENFLEKLRVVDEKKLFTLQTEYYLLPSFPLEQLKARAKSLLDLVEKDHIDQEQLDSEIYPQYPVLVHAHFIEDASGHYLEVANAVPQEVEIQSVQWLSKRGGRAKFQSLSPITFPLSLAPRQLFSVPNVERLYYSPLADPKGYSLHLTVNIKGQKQESLVMATPYHAFLTQHPIPVSTPEFQLSRNSFLTLDREKKTLRVKPGQWQVPDSIVVPEGYSLTIPAGTILQFPPEAALIAHGPLHLQGTEGERIVLEPIATENDRGKWQGVAVVNADSPSDWAYVSIRNTTGISRPGWELTGGVTFYRSDIRMDHCRFEGAQGEDALNIVHSQLDLKDISILDTASDAFDADFANGIVRGGLFQDIGKAGGGDAIDISGSTMTVTGTRFFNVLDKALSVGERSKMMASNLTIEQTGTAAVSKDGSTLHIANSVIRRTKNASLMAYMKKPEFGPATVEGVDLDFDGLGPLARAQTGNVMTINGKLVESENINVEQLYETIMKPGLRR